MVKVAAGRAKGGGGGLAGRLGVRKGGGGGIQDARQKIIQSNRTNIGDARDKLSKLAKNTDARSKLERIRNMKDGNLEVKKVGGITVTKKLDGKLSLSTKSKSTENLSSGSRSDPDQVTHIGRLTKTVSRSGQVALSSKSSRAAAADSGHGMRSEARSRSEGRSGGGQTTSGSSSVLRGAGGRAGEKENVRRRDIRDIDSLDDELMAARVDPLLLKKTVENSRSRSMGHMGSRSDRDRSPLRSRSPVRGRGYDYDDPRALIEKEAELLRRRQREAELHSGSDMTRGGVAGAGLVGVSPLQGTKVVIQNLQTTVTQEDIEELFGDIGALKKAKMITPGHAEVVFVNRSDAKKAVEIYHNRQLDGKPMKCQIVGINNPVAPGGATMKLPPSLTNRRRDPAEHRPPIEIDTIHKALFLNKKNVGKKPLFTITMPKKSKEEDRW